MARQNQQAQTTSAEQLRVTFFEAGLPFTLEDMAANSVGRGGLPTFDPFIKTITAPLRESPVEAIQRALEAGDIDDETAVMLLEEADRVNRSTGKGGNDKRLKPKKRIARLTLAYMRDGLPQNEAYEKAKAEVLGDKKLSGNWSHYGKTIDVRNQ